MPQDVRQVSEDTFDLLEPVTGVKKAWSSPGNHVPPFTAGAAARGPGAGAAAGRANALSAGEREELVAVLEVPGSRKAPREVWAVLIDEGAYLVSVSTMYRLSARPGRSASAARRPPIRPHETGTDRHRAE